MPDDSTTAENKRLVRASFRRWQTGTGSPFELLAPDADWTIVGSSPLSKTYPDRQAFMDEVIDPFNARLATPLVPTVRNIFAWFFRMKDALVISAIAFFDTRDFDEFWHRVPVE